MRSPLRTIIYALLVLGCFLRGELHAGPVRISFLQDDVSLRDTAKLLGRSGCKEESLAAFKYVVGRYYLTYFAFDLGKFPKPQDGFYSFPSTRDLVAALPFSPYDTQHDYEINCFDFMIVVSADRLRIGLRPDEVFGPFLFSKSTTNGVRLSLAATARDMFTAKYPPWYIEASGGLIPKSLADARVCLTAALFRDHALRMETRDDMLSAEVTEILRVNWRRQDLKFPKRFEVVLCHEVNSKWRTFATTHAALLFRRDHGYTYLEKAGGSGPFVRLDFDDRADLLPWLSASFKGLEHEYTHLFVTFNDTSIVQLELPK